tara:strand:+ start:73 stop:312 length:240 start_codon:yes stop_codon:yes gene_type:complete
METKHTVKIYETEKPARISKEIKASLKGVVSPKQIRRMKLEEIYCPVLEKKRQFLECFVCPDHIRRFKGEVHCTGEPLQ